MFKGLRFGARCSVFRLQGLICRVSGLTAAGFMLDVLILSSEVRFIGFGGIASSL